RRCSVGFGWLDRDGAALRHFEVETHHGLIYAADLLHVESAVAEPFALEDEQVAEDAKNDAVGNAGNRWAVATPPRGWQRSFEKRIALRIEQVAFARGNVKSGVAASFVNESKQGEKLRPGAISLTHRVWVTAGVGSQAVEQSRDRVVVDV